MTLQKRSSRAPRALRSGLGGDWTWRAAGSAISLVQYATLASRRACSALARRARHTRHGNSKTAVRGRRTAARISMTGAKARQAAMTHGRRLHSCWAVPELLQSCSRSSRSLLENGLCECLSFLCCRRRRKVRLRSSIIANRHKGVNTLTKEAGGSSHGARCRACLLGFRAALWLLGAALWLLAS